MLNHICRNLSKKDADRVRAVFKIGDDAVDVNVTDFLKARNDSCKIKLKTFYSFHIETDATVKRVFKTKTKFTYGYCDYMSNKIVLNLDHVLHSPVEAIVDTILHECAHAVDYHYYGNAGHGKTWREVSRMFGSHPRATSKILSEELAAKHAKKYVPNYKIVMFDDANYEVKVVSDCKRKLKNLRHRAMKNDDSTLGKLWMVKSDDYERIGPNYDKLERVAFR